MNRYVIFLVAGSLVIGLVLSELALRTIGFSFYILPWSNFHESWGYFHTPNKIGIHNTEGNSIVSINSRGFRDSERNFKKKENIYRIAMVGDSMVAGFEVDKSKRFTEKIQQYLSEKNSLMVEILNFSVRGFSTVQEYLVIKEEVVKYNPDEIYLFFYHNDLPEIFQNTEGPVLLETEGEQLNIVRNFENSKVKSISKQYDSIAWKMRFWIMENFRIVQLLKKAKYAVFPPDWMQKKPVVTLDEAVRRASNALANKQPVSKNKILQLKESWTGVEKILYHLKKDLSSKNIAFNVVYLPGGLEVFPDRKIHANYRSKFSGWENYDSILENICSKISISYITLTEEMFNQNLQLNQCSHGFKNNIVCEGHFNEYGHDLIANLLTKHLAVK